MYIVGHSLIPIPTPCPADTLAVRSTLSPMLIRSLSQMVNRWLLNMRATLINTRSTSVSGTLLIKEKGDGKAGDIEKQLMHTDCSVMDKLRYIPFLKFGGRLLFRLIGNLYEIKLIIFTTNLEFKELNILIRQCQNDNRIPRPRHTPLHDLGNR